MKSLEKYDDLYQIVDKDNLARVVGGSHKLPGWVKYVNGISGLIGEAAEPGSVHWKHH